MEQPAESVAPAHRTWLALAGDVQASRRIRRSQLQRPVRTMGVVVGGIDPEDLLERHVSYGVVGIAGIVRTTPLGRLGRDPTT